MADDDGVFLTEKDFTPTPSSSPTPGADATEAAAAELASSVALSAIVDDEEGEKIMSSSESTPIVPTADDVNAVNELGISITDPAEPPFAVPSARQIVSIGTEDDSYAFTFHEEELNAILAKVPAGWKVSVVSVVGAFRTGKSFLLSWFLRYLEAHCVRRGGKKKADEARPAVAPPPGFSDMQDEGKKWYERVHTLNQHDGSFDWRGGKERNTTGMWMWSDPYFLPRPNGEEVAILLVDTQGMFDHETTVGLTAAIFGLSTLLSSYQIYNVDKRIQEDNLQQLALFSEYGRMAFEAEEKAAAMGVSEEGQETVLTEKKKTAVPSKQPFQKIEFLVRDWQNFDTEDESDIASMEAEMATYLKDVIAEREAADLKETREQINSCFEDISCFMLTHPGFAVIKNKYEGDVSKIEPLFMSLLDRYCERVFKTAGCAEPKTVRGRELSAVELGTYIKSYANMFEEIGAHFPEPETMLEATSKANNANAVTLSVDAYTDIMNAVAGPKANDYHQPEYLKAKHEEAIAKALLAFDEIANFGSRKAIVEARDKVVAKIAKDYEVFVSLNDGRNPLLGLETYILPMLVAGVSFVLRWVADVTCSSWSQTCRASSDLLSHVYMVVFFFLAIVASTKAKQVSDLFSRAKAAFRMLTDSKTKND
ncbi:hypothetical protein ACHAXT_004525 [Thalassiosira profunda]